MKAVVWNMAHKVRNWSVLDELGADIALVNEAPPAPTGLEAVSNGRTVGRDGYRRPWSAAVVSHHPILRTAPPVRRTQPVR